MSDKMAFLNVEHLDVHFPIKTKGLFQKQTQWVRAVNNVSFTLQQGKTLGVVGESGCGKSTLARAIMKLVPITGGKIELGQTDLATLSGTHLKKFRKNFQIIFQDPEAALNPRLTVGELIEEPIKVYQRHLTRSERQQRVLELMTQVGLNPYMIRRYPHEFSGGQRQRICIARAISINPQLLVCDEAVSALDVSIRAQIVNLLNDLKQQFQLTYLFISHDLSVTRYISDEIMVMYLGQIMEKGTTRQLIESPRHPYTQALISAVPLYQKEQRREKIDLVGDIPSPINLPPGCPFQTRCSLANQRCLEEKPELRQDKEGRLIACHQA